METHRLDRQLMTMTIYYHARLSSDLTLQQHQDPLEGDAEDGDEETDIELDNDVNARSDESEDGDVKTNKEVGADAEHNSDEGGKAGTIKPCKQVVHNINISSTLTQDQQTARCRPGGWRMRRR